MMHRLENLDLYANQPEAESLIRTLLAECLKRGISKVHLSGYDFSLQECELRWQPISSKAHALFKISDLPYRWFLVDRRRGLSADMTTLREGLQRLERQRQWEE